MTIQYETFGGAQKEGNGVNTDFPWLGLFESASEMKVLHTDADAVITTLVDGVHYVASPYGTANGSVTYPRPGSGIPALPVSEYITIVPDLPYTQLTDLIAQGKYRPEVAEKIADNLTRLIQQIRDNASRGMKMPAGTPMGFNYTLPAPVANKLFAYASDGLSIVLADFVDSIFVNQEPAPAVNGSLLMWQKTSTGDMYYLKNGAWVSFYTVSRFNTVSDMVADTSLLVGDIINTDGYYAIGDYGDNDYEVVASGTGTDDGGSYIDLYQFQAKAIFKGGTVSAQQFGFQQGGARAENTTSLLNAIAYLASLSPTGGILRIYRGSYDINNGAIKIPSSVHIQGDGRLNTRLMAFGSGVTIQVGESGTRTLYTSVKGLYIQGETTTACTNILALNVELMELEDLFLGAGSLSISGGGGICLQIENEEDQFCQFNAVSNVRCAPAAGSSIKLTSSPIGAGWNTSTQFSNVFAVGSGATPGERILTVDTDSSSHTFDQCYFEPSDAADCSVKIYGKNIHFTNTFIDGHPNKTALEITANATGFSFTGNIDGDTVNDATDSKIDSNYKLSYGRDIDLIKSIGGSQKILFSAGNSGNFGFVIEHDGVNDKLTISSKNGAGVTYESFNIDRATGQFSVLGAFGTKNSVAATTLGSVANKLPVWDENGVLLGFIPIYDFIT